MLAAGSRSCGPTAGARFQQPGLDEQCQNRVDNEQGYHYLIFYPGK